MRIVFIRLTAQKSKWVKTRRHCPLSAAFWALSCGSTGLPLALKCFANSPSLSLSLFPSLSLYLPLTVCLSVHYVIDFIAHNAVAASLATMRGLMTQRGPSLLLLLCPLLLLLCSASAWHWPVLRAAVPAHLPPGGFI